MSVVALAAAIAPGADERLARAAGEHDDAGAAVPEAVDGLLLVGPQVPVGLVELDRVRLPVDVAGEVLGGPADLEQLLLEGAALARVHDDGEVVDALADERPDLLVPQHLLEHRAVGRAQHEAGALAESATPSFSRVSRP